MNQKVMLNDSVNQPHSPEEQPAQNNLKERKNSRFRPKSYASFYKDWTREPISSRDKNYKKLKYVLDKTVKLKKSKLKKSGNAEESLTRLNLSLKERPVRVLLSKNIEGILTWILTSLKEDGAHTSQQYFKFFHKLHQINKKEKPDLLRQSVKIALDAASSFFHMVASDANYKNYDKKVRLKERLSKKEE